MINGAHRAPNSTEMTMKKFLIAVCVLMSEQALGQILAIDSSYAATDTTVWATIRGGNLELVFIADDSCNVALDIDYAESSMKTTNYQTYRVTDSTNSVSPTGLFKGYVLRAGSTNNIPGAGAVRLRVTKLTDSGKNGTTSPTYDAYIKQY